MSTFSQTFPLRATLREAPAAPLLARLFAAAEDIEPALWPDLGGDHERLMRSKTEYREFYGQLKDLPLAVSRETGQLLYLLARSMGAQSVVEFGTSFGISTIHLAAALRDNGGGRLITCEFEPSKAARAQAHLAEAGLADLVELRIGDALETLESGLPPWIDLVLLDGAKSLYSDVLDLLEERLRPGALLVADNAGYSPDYLARVRAPDGGYLSIPLPGDVELSLRIG